MILLLSIGQYINLNLRPILLVLSHIKEWVMLDVYLIALGIAAIKMQDYASVFHWTWFNRFITMSILSILILIHINLDELWNKFYPINNKKYKITYWSVQHVIIAALQLAMKNANAVIALFTIVNRIVYKNMGRTNCCHGAIISC